MQLEEDSAREDFADGRQHYDLEVALDGKYRIESELDGHER